MGSGVLGLHLSSPLVLSASPPLGLITKSWSNRARPGSTESSEFYLSRSGGGGSSLSISTNLLRCSSSAWPSCSVLGVICHHSLIRGGILDNSRRPGLRHAAAAAVAAAAHLAVEAAEANPGRAAAGDSQLLGVQTCAGLAWLSALGSPRRGEAGPEPGRGLAPWP